MEKQDFWSYVNKDWLNTAVISDGESRSNTFTEVSKNNYNNLKKIVNKKIDINNFNTSNYKKIDILYNQYINNSNNNFIFKIIKDIQSIKTKNELNNYILNNFVLYDINIPINYEISPSFINPNKNILHLSPGGLGLPDKQYYFSNTKEKVRDEYIIFIKNLLNYFNLDFNNIFGIEKILAEYSYTNEQKRNPDLMNNEFSFELIKELYPDLDIEKFFNLTKVRPSSINIINPSFLKNYLKIWNYTPLQTLKEYYIYLYLLNVCKYINKQCEDIFFNFYSKELNGIQIKKPEWKRSIINIENNAGMLLSKLFVENFFTEDQKNSCYNLIKYLKQEFDIILSKNKWMSPETKKLARNKLDKMNFQIGYPNKWINYDKLNLDKNKSYLENILECKRFNFNLDLDDLYKEVDPDKWHIEPHVVNAYYSPQENKMVFPAGILQKPFFDKNDIVASFGGIGSVIGHEATHGFDDQGRKFNEKGELYNWWNDTDSINFSNNIKPLIELFNNTTINNKAVNGKLTLGENLADLGGVQISLNGLKSWMADNNVKDVDKHLKHFFESYAKLWKNKQTDETTLLRLSVDPHAPPKHRVNNILPHFNDFIRIYDINPNDPMYIGDNYKVSVWK